MFLEKVSVNSLRGGIGIVYLEKVANLPIHCKMYARITIPKGASIGLHTHTDDEEIVYVLEGNGKVLIDGALHLLKVGSVNLTKKGENHSIMNDEDAPLVILAVINE